MPKGRRRFCSDPCADAAQARATATSLDHEAIAAAAQAQATVTRLDAELAQRVSQAARLAHELAMAQSRVEAMATDTAMLATFIHTLHGHIGGDWYGPATRNLVAKYLATATDGQPPTTVATPNHADVAGVR